MGTGIIGWLVIGGVIGWLASIVMRTDAQQGIFLNVVVGIVGAMIGGWILNSNFHQEGINLWSFVAAFIGACILLGIVNLIRRGSVR